MTSLFPFQNLHKILLHINVDRAVTGECTASFDVTSEGRDEVRIFDQFIDVADEGATGEVAACNIAKTLFLFFTSLGIDDSHNAVKSCLLEHCFDVAIVLLLRSEREKLLNWKILIFLQF